MLLGAQLRRRPSSDEDGDAVATPIAMSAPRPLSPRHILFLAPLILLHLACALVFVVGVSPAALAAFAIASLIQIFGITAGYHRLLAHRSFKTSRPFQLLLAVSGVLAAQNGPLWWVGHHRHHHLHTDSEDDTHSPRAGFFWSHMGWLFSPRCIPVRIDRVADLNRIPELRLLERYYYVVNFGYWTMLYLAGELWRRVDPGAGIDGLQLLVWAGVVSTVCVYHIIWSANSFCHRFGTRRFPTADDSRNNAIVSLLTLGDGWHHNHHQFPYSARHGIRWWELDINYAILRLLAWCRVVWDLKLPQTQGWTAHTPSRGPR
jgi:stearoyl-CoA desaturase (delta-9 desaturase)